MKKKLIKMLLNTGAGKIIIATLLQEFRIYLADKVNKSGMSPQKKQIIDEFLTELTEETVNDFLKQK